MEQKKSSDKDYRRQSPQYFLIGLIVALSTTLLAFEYRSPVKQLVVCNLPGQVIEVSDDLPPVTLRKPETKPAPKPVPPKPSDEPYLEPNPVPEPLPVPEPVVSKTTVKVSEIMPPEELDEEPVLIAEQMPEYPGGEEALYRFLGEETDYPNFALENGLESKLFVQFIVNSDGTISDVKVLNPQGYGFDEEAERVISKMPKWKPGKQGGRKVRVYYVLPLNFALK